MTVGNALHLNTLALETPAITFREFLMTKTFNFKLQQKTSLAKDSIQLIKNIFEICKVLSNIRKNIIGNDLKQLSYQILCSIC